MEENADLQRLLHKERLSHISETLLSRGNSKVLEVGTSIRNFFPILSVYRLTLLEESLLDSVYRFAWVYRDLASFEDYSENVGQLLLRLQPQPILHLLNIRHYLTILLRLILPWQPKVKLI